MPMTCKYLENQVCIRSDGQYRLCCLSLEDNNKENIATHSPEEWHNSEFHTKVKQQLANDEWPDACKKCKSLEDVGLVSQRLKPRMYGPGISHLDLRFGNSCNLQCISCHPHSSSSIAEEASAMQAAGAEPVWQTIPVNNVNWATEENFEKLLDQPIQEVYLTGGEPMMVKNLDKFLERLDRSTALRFNTNCTLWNPKLEKLLREFDTVAMSFSLDAVDEKIEYIRYGTKWKEAEENAKRYADFCYVNLTPTISILNAWFYDDIKEYADKMNWTIFENILYYPQWLYVKNAPDILKSQFQGITDKMLEGGDPKQQEVFKRQITSLDKWRGNKISDYLPPVAKAYGLN